MWWRLLHSDTQRRRIRYIGKVNNRVCMESFGCRAAGYSDWRDGDGARRRLGHYEVASDELPELRGVLMSQILNSIFGLRGFAGRALHQILREIVSAMLVDLFPQPLQKRLVMPLG